jgi:hypothetical protein
MRYHHFIHPFVFLSICVFLIASPVLGKETIKDESGEVLYTIDDDGIVSMFETSPGTDVTLSVTRGTREQMQPQVTEVTPASIPAGVYNIIKLTGRNLVGAKVKLSVPGIEVGGYSGKAKRLDIPVNVPLSLPPGEVTIDITTPIGSTQAKFYVTDVQIGCSGMPKREDVIKHSGQ